MRETAVTFGPDRGLVGIQATPGDLRPEAPAVLFWNAGALHHVGPYRMFVSLARRLSDEGYPTLRFDAAGVGDSLARRDDRPHRERMIADVCAAMDFMQERSGVSRFILVGLCSGADDAHFVTVCDERVVGAALLDGYAYPTRRFVVRRYADFLRHPARWLPLVGRVVSRLLPRKASAKEPVSEWIEDEFSIVVPPRADVERDLQTVIDRGVQLLFVYSGEVLATYNYAEQWRDMFPRVTFGDHAACLYMQHADHTFTSIALRNQLIDRVCEWIELRFGDPGAV